MGNRTAWGGPDRSRIAVVPAVVGKMKKANQSRVKIAVPITRGTDDFPPVDWEHLWTVPCGVGQYEVDNIPFFATGISSGDVISAHTLDDHLIYDQVVRYGGHSTVRVVMSEVDQKEKVRKALARLGCEIEGSHLPKLFAVDVPALVNYAEVIGYLEEKAAENLLDYEEASIQHKTN